VSQRFQEVITTRDRLRSIVGEPSSRVTAKVIDHIDAICSRFIAASPFIVVSTRGGDGLLDQSPKGDPAGFVAVLDGKTLAIPDRLGNRRIDTFENVLTSPAVGLLFIIPGYAYTLRVSGKASLVRDPNLQRQLAVGGQEPQLIMIVHVEQAFMHCAKSMARAKIWKPDEWPDTVDVPSLAEAMVEHGKIAETREQMQAIIEKDFATRMY
jgi:uncharacterized protein